MGTYRFFKNGGNWSLKEGKMGLTEKDKKTSPGKALFTVRGGRVLDKWVLWFFYLVGKVP